jgi:hypothetical protein
MWAVPDEVAITHKIRTNGPSYQVNLRDFSCSCQSWLSDRCRYNTSDIRRLCKHQVRILEKNNLFTADALMLCLADAVPLHSRPYCIARIKSSDIGCTIIRYQNEPWLDVLVSAERRPLRRYGLNIEEDRWAYGGNFGERPPESKRIKALVHAWLARPDSARFHEVPDLPEEAVIAKQKFAEEAVTRTATTQMTEDEAKGRCFICRLKIAPTSSPHELMEARDEKRLLRLQRQLAGYKLLIIDELGYVPLSQTGAELLFEVFSQRYERGSTVVTSNLPFDEWTSVFSSERLTGALLDRLTHHVHILEMNGDSYRLNQSKRRARRASSDPPPDNPTKA